MHPHSSRWPFGLPNLRSRARSDQESEPPPRSVIPTTPVPRSIWPVDLASSSVSGSLRILNLCRIRQFLCCRSDLYLVRYRKVRCLIWGIGGENIPFLGTTPPNPFPRMQALKIVRAAPRRSFQVASSCGTLLKSVARRAWMLHVPNARSAPVKTSISLFGLRSKHITMTLLVR